MPVHLAFAEDAKPVAPMSAGDLQKLLKPKKIDKSKTEPRVHVKGFVLEGVEEYPEYDVGAEQISTLVNDLYEQMGEKLSLADLKKISNAITDYYRSHGYLFARAYIPQQKLKNGIVKISVNEGVLSAVDIRGNESYDTVTLLVIFEDVIGRSVQQKELESRLVKIRQLPGVQVYSYFSAGLEPGETRLNIVVREERTWSVSLSLDNHGSEQTGVYRLFGQGQTINLMKDGDRFNIGALYAAEPANNIYGYLNYFIPFFGFKQGLELTASGNQFDVSSRGDINSEALKLNGEVVTGSVKYQFQFAPSATFTSSLFLEGVYKLSEIESGGESIPGSEVAITGGVLGTFFNYEVRDWYHNYYLGLDLTGLSFKFDEEAQKDLERSESAAILHYDAAAHYYRLPLRSFIKLGLRGQLSSDGLPSVEQFGLTGSQAVRAYEPAIFSTDTAYVGTVEWVFQPFIQPYVKRLLPFLFMDYGSGEQLAYGTVESEKASFAGAGLGLQYQYKTYFQTYITFGFPISHSLPETLDQDSTEDPVLYAMLKVNY